MKKLFSLLVTLFLSNQIYASIFHPKVEVTNNIKTFLSGDIFLDTDIYFNSLCVNKYEFEVEPIQGKNIQIWITAEEITESYVCPQITNIVEDRIFLGDLAPGRYEVKINQSPESLFIDVY